MLPWQKKEYTAYLKKVAVMRTNLHAGIPFVCETDEDEDAFLDMVATVKENKDVFEYRDFRFRVLLLEGQEKFNLQQIKRLLGDKEEHVFYFVVSESQLQIKDDTANVNLNGIVPEATSKTGKRFRAMHDYQLFHVQNLRLDLLALESFYSPARIALVPKTRIQQAYNCADEEIKKISQDDIWTLLINPEVAKEPQCLVFTFVTNYGKSHDIRLLYSP